MALSEQEQRHLDELEAALRADDPRLARLLSTGLDLPRAHRAPGNPLVAVGVVAGLSLMVAGLRLHPMVGLLGFLVLLASVMAALRPARPSQSELWAARAAHPAGQRRRAMDREQHPGSPF